MCIEKDTYYTMDLYVDPTVNDEEEEEESSVVVVG
jgi:hypothetical protein